MAKKKPTNLAMRPNAGSWSVETEMDVFRENLLRISAPNGRITQMAVGLRFWFLRILEDGLLKLV